MTTAFQFNPFTGNFDLVTTGLTPGQITGGNPNQFSYFDSAGTLASLPNWNVDVLSTPNRYGLRYFVNVDPAGVAAYSVTNQIAEAVTPTASAPNDTEVPLQIGIDLDPTNTGFGLGDGGLATRVLDIYASTRTSSANGTVVGANVNLNMGDPVITGGSVDGVTGLDVFVGSDQGFSTGNVRGLNINSNYIAGSAVTNGASLVAANFQVAGSFDNYLNMYQASGNFDPSNAFNGGMSMYQANMNIAGSLGNGQGFVDNTQFQSGSSVTGDWNSASLGPNFQTGSAVRSFTGLNVNPQFNAPITDDTRGIGVFFNNPTAGTNITGMDISINGGTSTTGGISGLNINVSGTDANPQGVYGIQSSARIGVNAQTILQPAQGFQIGSRIAHDYTIAPGAPVTGTDSLGLNFAGNLIAQDDVAVGGFGLGWASYGTIASMAVASTKTVDKATVSLVAATLPDPGYTTGGNITELNMVRVPAVLPQGGTANITNLYGFKIDSGFGDFGTSATNAWGLYLDSTANNYLGQGNTQLGGSTSGRLSIKAAPVTTSYALTMPGTQGAPSTVLTNDGAGNLSWAAAGSSGFTTFPLVDGQASFADVTGFLVNPSIYKSFTAEATVKRYSTNILANGEDTAFYANLGTAINPGVGEEIYSIIQTSDSGVLLGGRFAGFNGNTAKDLVKVDSSGVEVTSFTTNIGTGFDQTIFALAEQANSQILVGGNFTTFNGNARTNLVRLNADGTEDTAFYTNLGTSFNSDVNSIFVQADGKILVGGAFTSFNGNTRKYLVRLNSDGTEDTTFYTNLGTSFDSSVEVVTQAANTDILVGGSFLLFNGNTRNYLVRLDSTGVEVSGFNGNYDTAGGVNSTIYAIAEQPDTKIVVGGDFTTYNGATVGYIIRLAANGTPDSAFITANGTGFAGPVGPREIKMQGTKIAIVGGFTSFNGTGANRLARLLSTGAVDSSFATAIGTGLNQFTQGLCVQTNGQLVIGGQFTLFNGLSRRGVIRYGVTSLQDLINQFTLKGVYHDSTSTWVINTLSYVGDDTGAILQMTNAGQLQYTTSLLGGTTVDSYIKFSVVSI